MDAVHREEVFARSRDFRDAFDPGDILQMDRMPGVIGAPVTTRVSTPANSRSALMPSRRAVARIENTIGRNIVMKRGRKARIASTTRSANRGRKVPEITTHGFLKCIAIEGWIQA